MSKADWILRPIVWFATASTINVILHESSHALMAAALGLHPTLYQYWVDWPPDSATLAQEAAARAAGPVFSLILGLCWWLAYRKAPKPARLPLLYLAAGSVAMFFGNLMSMPFVGDSSGVARWLELPMPVRYTISALGAAATASIMFWFGRQLQQWIPDKAGRAFGVIALTVVPALVGTALIILINQPIPPELNFTTARIGEQSMTIFTVIGAATGRRTSSAGQSFRLWWMDGTIALATILVVRLMVPGILL